MRTRGSLVSFAAALALSIPGTAWSAPLFGPATSLTGANSTSYDSNPSLSSDGLTLFFESSRPGGSGSSDFWAASRPTSAAPFGAAVNLGASVNSTSFDGNPDISRDGLSLYFGSTRGGGIGGQDLWVSTRVSTANPFGSPVNLGAPINSSSAEVSPDISADGLTILFHSNRSGGSGGLDLWMATRPNTGSAFGAGVNLGSAINTAFGEWDPSLSADSLTLFFGSDRPGGFGGGDVWLSTRASVVDSWGTPVNLGPNVNSSFDEEGPDISWDGSTLVFGRNGDLFQAAIVPEPATVELVLIGIFLLAVFQRRRAVA